MKLLIVDDHAGVRALIRELLGHLASEVHECASAEEAIARCAKFQPDCVTMDFRMGGMDGIAAAEQIRAMHPATRLIMVTQFDHPVIRQRARNAGADHFVLKDRLSELNGHVSSLRSPGGQ